MARLERENLQRKYLRIGAIVIILLAFGIIGYGILDLTILRLERPVAVVDGQKLTVNEFQAQHKFTRWRLVQQYQSTLQFLSFFGQDPNYAQQFQASLDQIKNQLSEANETVLVAQTIDEMIQNKLIEIEAKKLNISVSDAEVDVEMQKGFNYFPDGTATPEPTVAQNPTSTLSATQLALVTATPTATLPAATATATLPPTATATIDPSLPTATPTITATPYTEEGYKKQVSDFVTKLKEFNFTESDLRKILYYQKLREKVQNEMTRDITAEQDQVWARHILVSDETAAQSLYSQLSQGKDWTALAAEASQDTSNKDRGGDLGWFSRGDMVKEFEDVAFKLNIGEISEPVKTSFGWHIIQVLGHETRTITSAQLDELRSKNFYNFLKTEIESSRVTRTENWKGFVPTEPVIPPDLLQ